MAVKLFLARTFHTVERVIDALKRVSLPSSSVIDCYGGYTASDHIVVRGRVLVSERMTSGNGRQSRWQNFKDFLQLFFTDELQDVTVTAPAYDVTTRSDEEGFFVLAVPRREQVPSSIKVSAEGMEHPLAVPVYSSENAAFGVISDIDDTVLRTGAFSLIKNLWTSATGNVHEREVFPDAIELMKSLAGEGASFFYVSSSPWNLYDYLQSIFARTELPLGPFFLRDLGISPTQFITGTHGDHKTDAIERILAANPQLPFTLIGDTGQHDPHIYADIVSRYPNQVVRVILRRAGTKPLSEVVKADVVIIENAGVSASVVQDYRALT
ncbi:DUF2183 domain-containing protein [Rhodobacteraceae bacterium]|nr:DUF2183 domain-containing protein [Paracoccaceae bacterium]